MVDIQNIMGEVKALGTDAIDLAKNNPLASAGVGIAAVGGTILGVTALVKSKKRKSKSKSKSRKSSSKRKKRMSRRKKSPKYARTAGKRKDRSHKRIRMTKNGQPYIITASGKAKFIKKKSARLSRKRKGGRY